MSFLRTLGFLAALLPIGDSFDARSPRASYPTGGKRKANPKKKAARKRQKKARAISRGRA